jgi:type I restriction enzyme S subunit
MSVDALLGGLVARGLGDSKRIKWPLARSSEIFELRYGKALVEGQRRPGSVPVFGSNGRTGSHDTALFAGPGVILGRKGAGHLGVHWSSSDFWVIDTAYSLVVAENIDLRFAYYLIGYVGLDHLKHGTSNPSLTRDAFAAQYFPVPPLTDQRSIAAALVALDDKIESNRKIESVIAHLVDAEFQRSMTDADPLFVRLGDLAVCVKGVSYKSVELSDSRTSLVTLKSFDRRGGYKRDGLKPYVGPFKKEQIIAPGEIAVAQTDLTQGAEIVGRAIRVPASETAETLVASLDLVIVRPNSSELTSEYLFGALTAERFRQYCRSRTSGTTVLHLASDAIPEYKLPLLPRDSRDAFAKLIAPLLERKDVAAQESARLTSLRDALLPELLSGRVQVRHSEGVLGEGRVG